MGPLLGAGHCSVLARLVTLSFRTHGGSQGPTLPLAPPALPTTPLVTSAGSLPSPCPLQDGARRSQPGPLFFTIYSPLLGGLIQAHGSEYLHFLMTPALTPDPYVRLSS